MAIKIVRLLAASIVAIGVFLMLPQFIEGDGDRSSVAFGVGIIITALGILFWFIAGILTHLILIIINSTRKK